MCWKYKYNRNPTVGGVSSLLYDTESISCVRRLGGVIPEVEKPNHIVTHGGYGVPGDHLSKAQKHIVHIAINVLALHNANKKWPSSCVDSLNHSVVLI